MKATVTIDIQPFRTPNFVAVVKPREPHPEGATDDEANSVVAWDPEKERGFNKPHGNTTYPLRDIDANILSAMCDEFRKEVFRKAEKEDPRHAD